MDKIDCVCAFDGAKPLCEASDFIGIRCLPDRAFAAPTEFAIFGNRAGVRVDVVPMHGVEETHVGDNSAAGEWRLGGHKCCRREGHVRTPRHDSNVSIVLRAYARLRRPGRQVLPPVCLGGGFWRVADETTGCFNVEGVGVVCHWHRCCWQMSRHCGSMGAARR
jgi:hypothetical protein